MSGFQKYVAIQEFSLNVSKGGKVETLMVRVGEALDFDGLNVQIDGEIQGVAAALRKVVGEWIEPYNGSAERLLKIQEKIRGKVVSPMTLRKVIANSSIEHSSPDTDHDISRKQKPGAHEDLKKMVNEKEVPQEAPASKITFDDETVVGTVTHSEGEADVRSNSSVEISDAEADTKRVVVSNEDSVVKETKYADTQVPGAPKTASKISVEQAPVKKTDYAKATSTDIGSSTQAQTVSTVKKDAKKTPVKEVVKKVIKQAPPPVADDIDIDFGMSEDPVEVKSSKVSMEQDGVVVKKTSAIVVEHEGGIESVLTVGGNTIDEDAGVTFSSNNEVNDGEVVFSKSGGYSPVEINEDSAVVVTTSDDGIDVSDLLDSL